MSTFKKLLALSLALAMVLSFSAFAADYKDDTYKDAALIDEDCADAVELMYALDIMKGDQNSNFNPTGTITRAEIAKMIYVVLNKGKDDQAVNFKYNTMFTDVPGDAWYAGYVNYCAATKLIDGFNGKFLPLQPVTTAQAAKMLLTAIGYSSAERNYTGANWEKNVLSDASIVGLLEDYNYPTNQNAPRQWVAVMFENMLLGAYTYVDVRPGSASGLLTGSMGETEPARYKTMGEKYFDLASKTGYLFATDNAYIDVISVDSSYGWTTKDLVGGTLADGDEGYDAVFATSGSDKKWIHVCGAGLGYMDLGQQYRVIWNTRTDDVYSVRNTGKSAVGEARLEDITVVNSQGTNKNDALNRYVFTIGDLEGRLQGSNASAKIKALRVNTRKDAKNAYEDDYTATILRNEINKNGENSANLYHAVDKDGNGTIDYMIIQEYQYGQVSAVRNHKYYGDYFTATNDNGTFKPTGFTNPESESKTDTSNWYLSDVVNCETAIEKSNVIKTVYNFDNDKYDVEVLPVVSGTFEKMTTKKVYTIDGEDYRVAKALSNAKDIEKDFYDTTESQMVRSNLKTEVSAAYDGDLIVLVGKVKGGYTDIDEINAQLVMVTDAYLDIRSNNRNQLYVDYMTIDGEEHKEISYTQDTDDYLNFYELLDNGTRVANEGNDDEDFETNSSGNLIKSPELLKNHKRLFKLVEHDDDTVSLIRLTATNAEEELDYADTLLDGYLEYGHDSNTVNLDTAKNKIDDDFIEGSNKFFFSYKDSKGRLRFSVGTLDELADGSTRRDTGEKDADGETIYEYKHACIQGLYQTKRSVDTHLAGHIYYEGLTLGTENGYLYTGLDYAYDIKDDYWYLDEAVFSGSNPDRGTIQVNTIDGKEVSKTNNVRPLSLYSYTCEKVNGDYIYDLTLIDERDVDQTQQVGNENYYFDFDYDRDPDDEDKIVADEKDELNAKELTNSLVVSGDRFVTIGGKDYKLTSSAVIALKQVELLREHTLVRGEDGVYFNDEAEIAFVTWDELVEEDEDGVSVNRIYNGPDAGDEYEDDVTYDYFSDIYYKTNSDGNITALYVIVYAREVQANWD